MFIARTDKNEVHHLSAILHRPWMGRQNTAERHHPVSSNASFALQSCLHNIKYVAMPSPSMFTLGTRILPCSACMNAISSKSFKHTDYHGREWPQYADNKNEHYPLMTGQHKGADGLFVVS